MLWRGTSGGVYPDPKKVDMMIGKEIIKNGYRGGRDGRKCTFASTQKDQALGYCADPSALRIVTPHIGSKITWFVDVPDVITTFQIYLRDLFWDSGSFGSGRTKQNSIALIDDVRGCVTTLNAYLDRGRQRRLISMMIENFVDCQCIREIVYDGSLDALKDHNGEVWINGGCDLTEVTDEQ